MSMKKVEKAVEKYNLTIESRLSEVAVDMDGQDEKAIVPLWDVLKIPTLPAGVTAEMAKLPSNYAYWAFIGEQLEEALGEKKKDYEVWHAGRYEAVVNTEGNKGTTETYRETLIIQRWGEEYKKWKGEIGRLESAIRKVRIILKTLEMKKDMLQSIGGLLRVEWESQGMVDGAILTRKETGGKLRNLK